ncbi:hypothetical protein [Mucilaginibacter sp.]|jgi:hypothetical protein|uniref:hypothetical protein n=1 Tax=Mucilaginibacter sp. TaxID=1882438 RepID=UPI0035627C79
MELSENTFNRLSIALIEKNECGPGEALDQLATYQLVLNCGEKIRTSLPLQAALLTAINSAGRAFLGGVYLIIPDQVECLLPWAEKKTLNAIAIELGVKATDRPLDYLFTLNFGLPGNIDQNIIEVVASDWQGGVLVDGENTDILNEGKLPLGGIYAGGLAVGLAFMKVSKIHVQGLDHSTGLSLWRPDLNWLAEDAAGPDSVTIPSNIWILGLGHLGQAYLWALGLLPYNDSKLVDIYLQDFDKVVAANMSAGLLCVIRDVGRYKTRVCSDWLEARKIQTHIVERKFNKNTMREEEEPYVALCGFDNAYSRTLLEKAGFDFVVEAALGDDVNNFDKIMLHTFPSAIHSAEKIWDGLPSNFLPKEKVLKALTTDNEKECGILELTIAGKAVSGSFVGACAGALVIAELIKARNQGIKTDKIVSQLRFTKHTQTVGDGSIYLTELGRSRSQNIQPVTLQNE